MQTLFYYVLGDACGHLSREILVFLFDCFITIYIYIYIPSKKKKHCTLQYCTQNNVQTIFKNQILKEYFTQK